jgi:hypothetical protein
VQLRLAALVGSIVDEAEVLGEGDAPALGERSAAIDLLLVVGDTRVTLCQCSAPDARWDGPLTSELCRRWIAGVEIVGVHADDPPTHVVTLANGVMLVTADC